MRFYLSSYKLGEKKNRLPDLMPEENYRIAYIPNALDFKQDKKRELVKEGLQSLEELGLKVELLDLRNYFGRREELKEKIDSLGGIFVQGGNTFVLRQAMKLSGLDEIIHDLIDEDFLYAGYSAGICVLAPDFKALQQVDDPAQTPYKEIDEPIWTGLNILDYIILPHYRSDHPESEDIEKEAEYCEENDIPYKTLKDGKVIIMDEDQS